MSPFACQLRANIRAYIARERRSGTTAMNLDNLRQCVPTPSPGLDGAPAGTNAQYYYAGLFRDICADERDIRAFVTHDHGATKGGAQ